MRANRETGSLVSADADPIADLERLARLHQQGALSDEAPATLKIEADGQTLSRQRLGKIGKTNRDAQRGQGGALDMTNDDAVGRNLQGMDELDFVGWNNADWTGVFAHYHTDDVLVDWQGQPQTHGIEEHVEAMKSYVETSGGGTPPQITSHPIRFGSGDWTCVVGEFANGARMVTVAKWRAGAIAEEYIWA